MDPLKPLGVTPTESTYGNFRTCAECHVIMKNKVPPTTHTLVVIMISVYVHIRRDSHTPRVGGKTSCIVAWLVEVEVALEFAVLESVALVALE